MKIRQLLVLLVIILVGCEKNKIDELPNNIIITDIEESLSDRLKVLLPEQENISRLHPLFFADTVQKNIILKKSSKVYVTFISEGAGYRNSLHWYSYNILTPPYSSSDINGTVLFPNITIKEDGGMLEPGYTLQLGSEQFPAGTVIGFFLVMNGWKDEYIDYENPIHYTDYQFNIGGKQQHILFKIEGTNSIILGFEDICFIDDVNGDKDFNDVVFAVSDNIEGRESTSFDLTGVVLK